ncbi:hypothetical protein [Cellulosimicrobium funkei]|uniref:hypothetical protein n=1 Tax=Cellulosimicrobium funkei TaxID=264251 RepID=UPI00342D1E5E
MWEVLGPIVRWPLYSPLRFFTVVVAALVVVFVVGDLNEEEGPTKGPSSATASPSPTPSITESESSSASGVSTASSDAEMWATDELGFDPAEEVPAAVVADAAAAFVAAWARPDLEPEAWAAGVRPLVTPALWEGLSVTAPSSLPDVAVAGEPRQVELGTEDGVFDVPTTGTWVRVSLVKVSTTSEWLVWSVEPTG